MLRLPLSRSALSASSLANTRRAFTAAVSQLGRAAVRTPSTSVTCAGRIAACRRTGAPILTPSHRRLSSAPPTSFADPERPELFYHLFTAPDAAPVFALSFLPEAPPRADSCAVLGWLPAAAPGGGGEAGLNDFRENAKFLDVLHEAIQSALRDEADEVQKNAAIQTQEGWMHVHDMRNVPALGRIGDPDDIIASVRVEAGQILAETYQPMPSYRLCTSDGILQLTEGLAQRLQETLRQRVQAESSP